MPSRVLRLPMVGREPLAFWLLGDEIRRRGTRGISDGGDWRGHNAWNGGSGEAKKPEEARPRPGHPYTNVPR